MADDLMPFTEQDRGDRMFDMRMNGKSLQSIARLFNCPVQEVERLCRERLPRVDYEGHQMAHREQVARMEELIATFHPLAKGGCHASAQVVIKASERTALLMALDGPPQRQPISVAFYEGHRETSTEKIRAALDRLVQEAPDPSESPSSDEL